jgi:hypothetical protein
MENVSITTGVRGSITLRFGLESTLDSSPQTPWFCSQIDRWKYDWISECAAIWQYHRPETRFSAIDLPTRMV